MAGYIYDYSPDFSAVPTASKMHKAIDLPEDDKEILSHFNTPDVNDDMSNLLAEGFNYNPSYSDLGSPTVDNDHNNPESKPIEDDEVPILGGSLHSAITDDPRELILGGGDDTFDTNKEVNYVPSAVVDYFNESTLTAKEKNGMDIKDFGLPRLRKYPLNDVKHVAQAIRMFHYVKDPIDKKVLAKNIIKKYNEYGMSTKVGKNNPLYEYVPDSMKQETITESSVNVPSTVGFEKPLGARTKKDVIMDHIKLNSVLYNNIFYSDKFNSVVKSIKSFEFLNYFYPSFKYHNLYTRLRTACGGLAFNDEVYNAIGLRRPFTDAPLSGLSTPTNGYTDDVAVIADLAYDADTNWYGADTNSVGHVYYCLRLYSAVYEILNDPNFTEDSIPDYYSALLMDWLVIVSYESKVLKDCEEFSPEYFKHCQYLHDLLWDPIDDIDDESAVSSNIVSILSNMKSGVVTRMNETGGDIVTKADMTAYLVKEMGMDDDLYLLPSTLEYPIINAASIRLAMDMITRIEPEFIAEYTANLNRKYHEFKCDFSISVDHPYAKYASDEIVDKMNRILSEGGEVVKDSSIDVPDANGPWYKSTRWDLNQTGAFDNTELGPADSSVGRGEPALFNND